MDKAQQRLKVLEHELAKLSTTTQDADDDDDDDLGEGEGIQAEMEELKKANAARQAKLDEYEKHQKWNVDNICHVTEERTVISKDAAKTKFTPDGFVVPTEPSLEPSSKPAAVKTVEPEKEEKASSSAKAVEEAKPAATEKPAKAEPKNPATSRRV